MKTISIRELHEKTGHWIREARRHGQLIVTDRGETVARIVPQNVEAEVSYFARRKVTPGLKKLWDSGELSIGTSATALVSKDREDRA